MSGVSEQKLLQDISESSSWAAISQNVRDFRDYIDRTLGGPDDGLGAYHVSSQKEEKFKAIGKAVFEKVFEMTSSLAFSHERSSPILQDTVGELQRVGLVSDVVNELGSDDVYTPGGGRILAGQIRNSKSAVGNFFQMIGDAEFSAQDQGMQQILKDYAVPLAAVAREGATDADHRPTAGLRIFSDILPDELAEELHGIGPEHARNSLARALIMRNSVFPDQLIVPEELAESYQEFRGFINDENAEYHSSILLGAGVFSASDFLRHAENDADRVEMATYYLDALDIVFDSAQRLGWNDLAASLYPDADSPGDYLKDDLAAFLDDFPEEAISLRPETVARLRGWSEGQIPYVRQQSALEQPGVA